jgi:hypothetical protein
MGNIHQLLKYYSLPLYPAYTSQNFLTWISMALHIFDFPDSKLYVSIHLPLSYPRLPVQHICRYHNFLEAFSHICNRRNIRLNQAIPTILKYSKFVNIRIA